jgi:hypothetical protein
VLEKKADHDYYPAKATVACGYGSRLKAGTTEMFTAR